ncbi:MAG: IS4 family transposase [Candidatus Nanopelagicales bacterium]
MNLSWTRNNSAARSKRQPLSLAIKRFVVASVFVDIAVRSDARWDPRRLSWQALLMAFDTGSALLDRFDNVRRHIGELFPKTRRVGRTYQGFVRALRRHSHTLLEPMAEHFRKQTQAMAGPHWQREGFLAFAVDGSQVECPRTKANLEGLGTRGKDPLGPSLWLTMIWHVGTGLPWVWRIGSATESEQRHLPEMLERLPARALLLMDAGFVGYELLQRILSQGHSFLVRVASHRQLLRFLGCAACQRNSTAYLWPAHHRDHPPLAMRLICRGSGPHKIFLLTNLSKEQLSPRQAGRLYRSRWGIEVYYRTLKQTLGRRRMLSGTPELAKVELAWTLMGLWLLGLLGVEVLILDGQSPWRLSAAATLRIVRKALNGQVRGPLRRPLAAAVKDTCVRNSSKKARNWPHKKRDTSPRPPRMRHATPAECLQAQQVCARLVAG